MRMRVLVVLGALALSLSVVACGDDKEEPGSASAAGDGGKKLTTVKVGALPTTANAPFFMGVKRGFFEEEGLDVKPEVLGGSAAVFPALMSGSLQFSFTGASTVLMSRSKGLPISIVVSAGTSTLAPVVVREDSDVKSFADLGGKTIGLPSLGSVPEFTIVGAAGQEGVEKDELKLLEVPYAEGEPALERKDVDAVWTSPPFSTRMLESGKFRSIGTAISGDLLGLGNSVFAAKDDYLDDNPEIAEAFARALDRSSTYAAEHPDEVLDTIPTFMPIEKGLLAAEDVELEVGKLRLDRLQNVHDFLVEHGYMKDPVALDQAVWSEDWAVSG